jgi:hypothetical protein
MKQLILCASIAALAMSSCSNDGSTLTPGSTESKAVGFSTFVEKTTRGDNVVTGTTYPTGGNFLVMGYNTGSTSGTLSSNSALNFMRNVVSFDGTSYTYYPTHYWTPNNYYSFFAVHPATDVSSVTTPAAIGGSNLPSVDLTVNADPQNQADLMMASALDQTSTSAAGKVQFNFGHQLSRIGFNAQLASDYTSVGAYVRVNSIVVSNVASEAKFAFNKTGVISVTPVTTGQSFTLSSSNMLNQGVVSSVGTSVRLNLSNAYLLMIPADYSAAGSTATITVNCTVTYADATSSTFTITKKLSDLNTANKWTAGQAYDYDMTISLTSVTFSAAISADWSATPTSASVN